MRTDYFRLKRVVFLIYVSLYSINLLAQDEEAALDLRYENWYQIEIIIFDRGAQAHSNDSESWPNNITLIYPSELDFLFSEDEWQDFITPEPNSDELERNTSVDTNAAVAQPSTPKPSELINRIDLADKVVGQEAGLEQTNTVSIEEVQLPEMITPRIKLLDEEKMLTRERKRLRSRSSYKILFHEAWRQPLHPSDESVDIVITGGDRTEDHYELEGTINLSLNRFLHLKTNLWRNSFVPNYGQEIAYWPSLPSIPEPVKPTLDAETSVPSNDLSLSLNNSSLFENRETTLNQVSLNPAAKGYEPSLNLSFNSSFGNTNAQPIGFGHALQIESTNLINEIVTFKQRRKMRSNELHYLDHPRLGLIIKIVPYEVYLPENTSIKDETGI